MNAFVQIFNHPLGHRVGWALLHSLWEGALAGAPFAVVRFGLRRRSANARYLAGCATLALLVAAPIITALQMADLREPEASSGARPARWLPLGPAALLSTANPVVSGAGQSSPDVLERLEQLNPLLPWMVQLWALGVLALSCRWLFGSRWIRRIKTAQTEPFDALWRQRLLELSHRLGIERPVTLLKSALVEVPMVVGWLRPVILLPASAVSGLTPAQLEAVLAHELAHVRRYDYLVNGLQTLVETLMFYHPVVWWVSRCIRQEREHCCDDMVVRLCGDKLLYARTLMTLEEARAVPQLALAAVGGSLLHRVRRLLGMSHEDGPPSAAEFGGIALVAIGCVFVVSGICLINRPLLYEAAALIRVNPSLAALGPGNDSNNGTAAAYFPYFLQTECLVMRSPAVLKEVIGSLKTNPKPGRPAGMVNDSKGYGMINWLKARLNPRAVPSTSAIEIRASDSDPTQAAWLANAVAAAYKRYRLDQNHHSAREAKDGLELRLRAQEEQVRKAETKLDQLRIELKIPDPITSENMTSVLISAESLRHIEALRIEGEAEYIKQKTLLEHLEMLRSNELPQTMPTIGVQDNQLNEYMQAVALVDQKLVSLQRELGPEHSEVIKALAQQADLREKVRDRTKAIMAGLRARLSATGQSLVALSNAVTQATQADSERAGATKQYFEAKRDLEELERFRNVLLTKLSLDDARAPAQDLIEILEEAVTPMQPMAPGRSRAINLAGVGLLLILTGIVLSRAGQARMPARA